MTSKPCEIVTISEYEKKDSLVNILVTIKDLQKVNSDKVTIWISDEWTVYKQSVLYDITEFSVKLNKLKLHR